MRSSIFGAIAAGLVLMTAGAAAAAELSALAWLAGDWREGESDGENFAQEIWLAPLKGAMPGVFRLVRGGRLIVHEYVLISEEDGQVLLRFKHYNSDYTSWEEDPLVFRLAEARPGFARFENAAPSPELPDLLEYRLEGERLTVTVADDPADPQAGAPMVFVFARSR